MSEWTSALSMAIFVATVPLLWVFRLLSALPEPLLLSHRQWPAPANFLLIGVITASVTAFVRSVSDGGPEEPIGFTLRFLITAVAYLFGFSLLVRQFAGLYPEYFVTVGRSGLRMRKALYRNVVELQEVRSSGGETEFAVRMRSGVTLYLFVPTHHRVVLRKAIEDNQPKL